ncbi:hypothetical protein SAMN04487950_0920 [Halogranum rubrum]|uniref:Uncharacterized protein n=1 Tax=Halogranum rubrum TaxID=553466 RepID=A0A1I4C388_9EURY|nr:hypothetical protein [Halogranum rubrum]SFK75243.1 hypothetical protein SAMN04487950_0920 [Halogranum rubrum]
MNPVARRIRQVENVNEISVLVIALVGAALFAYLAYGFGLALTEWFDQLPWLLS